MKPTKQLRYRVRAQEKIDAEKTLSLKKQMGFMDQFLSHVLRGVWGNTSEPSSELLARPEMDKADLLSGKVAPLHDTSVPLEGRLPQRIVNALAAGGVTTRAQLAKARRNDLMHFNRICWRDLKIIKDWLHHGDLVNHDEWLDDLPYIKAVNVLKQSDFYSKDELKAAIAEGFDLLSLGGCGPHMAREILAWLQSEDPVA